MAMPTWDSLEQVGAALGVLAAGIWSGIKLAVRAERKRHEPTAYSGPPDDRKRDITRKEWHDHLDTVSEHGLAIALLQSNQDNLKRDHAALEQEVHVFTAAFQKGGETLARLVGEFSSHVKRWEEVGIRANNDRNEILRRLERIEALARGYKGNGD